MTISLGVLAPAGAFATAADVGSAASTCEDAGIESIWLAEHAVLPAHPVGSYPYTDDGRLPIPPDTSLPDPLVWLAAASATTTALGLGTAYLGAPARNPLVLAKQAATLERLAPGRVHLGLGVGWCGEELRAGGVDPDDGPDRLEEIVEVLRALWQGQASHEGRHWSFSDLLSEPRPSAPIPLLIEVADETGALRAGRIGDGVLARHVDLDRTRALVDTARGAAEEAGRSPDDLSVNLVVTPDAGLRAEMEPIGVDRVIALLPQLGPAKFTRVVHALATRWNR